MCGCPRAPGIRSRNTRCHGAEPRQQRASGDEQADKVRTVFNQRASGEQRERLQPARAFVCCSPSRETALHIARQLQQHLTEREVGVTGPRICVARSVRDQEFRRLQLRPPGELRDQAGLAGAGLTRHEAGRRLPVQGALELPIELIELRFASNDRRGGHSGFPQ